MNIVWKKPDGGIAITHLTQEAISPKEEAAKLKERGDIPADWKLVATEAQIPESREFRNAWCWKSSKIDFDMDKAADITKERLRMERKPLLDNLDVEFIKAMEQGLPTDAIVAEKKRLRDITLLAKPTMTIEQLSALSC